jgi:hypothetical protein
MTVRNGKSQDDPYIERSVLIGSLREAVADQLHDLVVERETLGSQSEVVRMIRELTAAAQRVLEARGRQHQAEEMDLPVTPWVQAEREALGVLRHAALSLGGACGAWVVQMDFKQRRPESARSEV